LQYSTGAGWSASTRKANAKTKDFKIVLEDPRGRELVLKDFNTGSELTIRPQKVVTGGFFRDPYAQVT